VTKKVEVTIINQAFTFVGDDEERIKKVAGLVDERIRQVTRTYGIVNTMNAVIMAMMVLADEHLETRTQAKDLEGRALRLFRKVENIEVPCGVRDKW
jgi:cell division protein ZapA (FtsZ GTPase activity inhibitor)